MEQVLLWLWPLIVLGSVAAVTLAITNRDRRHKAQPGE